jgi:hypothetical protein
VLPVSAGVVDEYDPSAVVNQTPDQVTPAWPVVNPDPFIMFDAGNFLTMNFAAGGIGHWYNTPNGTTMVQGAGGTDYSLEFTVRPTGDLVSIAENAVNGGNYETRSVHVRWADDVNWFLLSPDRDSDDAGPGTTGSLLGGKTPFTIISGIDFSVPHNFIAAHDKANAEFDIFMDGAFATSVSIAALQVGGNAGQPQDLMQIGKGTTNGTPGADYGADWYLLRLHDNYVPEPATLTLIGLGTVLGLRRKRQR